MKTVILAGGLGTRLAEETEIRPKPMVEVGGMPILWHILKIYHGHGIDEFCIALGYRGEFIKRWFLDYANLGGDMRRGDMQVSCDRRDADREPTSSDPTQVEQVHDGVHQEGGQA